MTVYSFADFDQHEQVVFGNDPTSGLKAIIAIHNTHLGPALGGCRMYPYASEEQALRDVLRLSRGMTYKSALAELPLGGGKSVIIGDPAKHKSAELFQAMGRLVAGLSGRYILAQDSGTAVEDLQEIATQTEHVAGIQRVLDDRGQTRSGDPSPATAYGVFVGLKAAVKHRLKRDSLAGVRVAVQGVGNVGFGLAKYLSAEGAELYVSDVNEKNLERAVVQCGARVVEGDAVHRLEVDVFSPCALGGAIHAGNVDQLAAPVVAGAANNQLASPELALVLRQKDILYAPDFVINAGGIIHVHYLRTGRTWEESTRHVEGIAVNLEQIFQRADESGNTTAAIADLIAEERFKPVPPFVAQSAVA